MLEYSNDMVRRQDRLLDCGEAEQLLRNGEYGVLSVVGTSGAYGVPVNYVWDGDRSLYIHCAPQGEKLECVKTNPNVSFVVVGRTQVISEQFTAAYESVVIRGSIRTIDDLSSKMSAVELIVNKYSPQHRAKGQLYAEKSIARTAILCIDIRSMSGKTKRLMTSK